MKKSLYTILTIIVLFAFNPSKISAATQSTYFSKLLHNTSGYWGLFTYGYTGSMGTGVIKTINFMLPTGGLASTQSTLEVGQNMYLWNNKTEASWNWTGGWTDTPTSDGNFLNLIYASGNDSVYVGESVPSDQGSVSITSDNPGVLECINNNCVAKSPGYATIIVSFPPVGLSSSQRFLDNPLGFGVITLGSQVWSNGNFYHDFLSVPYSFSPIYYGVTVNARPNQSQVTVCNGMTNLTPSGGTFSWSYSDEEGDAQANYHYQVSTDPSFVDTSRLVYQSAQSELGHAGWGNGVMTANGGSAVITGLNQNTTYYSRIATYNNGINQWGNPVWHDCGGFTTPSIPPPTNAFGFCAAGGNSAQISWDNAAGYNTIYFRITDKTLYSTAQYETVVGDTSLWNQSATNNPYTIPTVPDHKYIWWIHTRDNNINPNQYDNWSPSVRGEFTCPNTVPYCGAVRNTCSAGGTATNPSENLSYYTWSCPGSGSNTISCGLLKAPPTPPATTTIKITKTPAVTLNKNGQCTLSWVIENPPIGATCTLNGFGANPTTPLSMTGTQTFSNLTSNQKYTITCAGGSLNPSISESVICRVNPDIKEK